MKNFIQKFLYKVYLSIRPGLFIVYNWLKADFNASMKGLDEQMRITYKKYFAQDEAGWIRFREEMIWHIKVGLILFPFICFFRNNELPIFAISEILPDFDIMDLPPDHIICLGMRKPISDYFPVYNFETPKYIIGVDLEEVKEEVRASFLESYNLSIGINWFLY